MKRVKNKKEKKENSGGRRLGVKGLRQVYLSQSKVALRIIKY